MGLSGNETSLCGIPPYVFSVFLCVRVCPFPLVFSSFSLRRFSVFPCVGVPSSSPRGFSILPRGGFLFFPAFFPSDMQQKNSSRTVRPGGSGTFAGAPFRHPSFSPPRERRLLQGHNRHPRKPGILKPLQTLRSGIKRYCPGAKAFSPGQTRDLSDPRQASAGSRKRHQPFRTSNARSEATQALRRDRKACPSC